MCIRDGRQAEYGGKQGFEKEGFDDVPFFHPQDAVKPQLLFPPFDEKAVGIEKQRRGEEGDDDGAQP